MDADTIRDLVRSAYRARVAGDMQGMLAHFDEDASFAFNLKGLNVTESGSPCRGRAALEGMFGAFVAALKLENWAEVAILVEGERAAVHWRATATSTATGASAAFDVVDLVEFRDGRIVSLYQSADTASLLALLGPAGAVSLAPPPLL